MVNNIKLISQLYDLFKKEKVKAIQKKPREIFKELGIEISKEFFLEGLSELEQELKEIKILGKKLGKI